MKNGQAGWPFASCATNAYVVCAAAAAVHAGPDPVERHWPGLNGIRER
jgi:hypothetical protein